jgi:hypothetical protein
VTSRFSPFYTTVINVVFWTLSLIPAVFTIWGVEDKATAVASTESDTDVAPGAEEKHSPDVNV